MGVGLGRDTSQVLGWAWAANSLNSDFLGSIGGGNIVDSRNTHSVGLTRSDVVADSVLEPGKIRDRSDGKLADLVAAERPNRPNRPQCELDPVTGMFYFEWIYDQGETCNPVSSYNLQLSGTGSTEWNTVACEDPSLTSCIVSTSIMLNRPFGFDWGDNIRARVSAANSNGESIWSDESQGCKFSVRPPCARVVSSGGATETTLDFVIAAGVSNIQGYDTIEDQTNYRIKSRVEGERNWDILAANLPFDTTDFTASSLVYGQSYEF